MKKFTIALLSCLVAIGITLFLVGLGMAGWNFKNLNEGGPFEVKNVDTQETVENIYIDAKDAEIVLKPSEDGKFKAEYQENKRYLYDVKLSDGEFRLTDITRRKWYHYLFSFNFTTPRIVLYLNAQQLENVSLSTRNAGIRSESTLEALRFTAETRNAGITVCNPPRRRRSPSLPATERLRRRIFPPPKESASAPPTEKLSFALSGAELWTRIRATEPFPRSPLQRKISV